MHHWWQSTTQYLRRAFSHSTQAKSLTSGLADHVGSSEVVARFLTSSNYYRRSTGEIKSSAFMPGPTHETSVFRHDGDPPDELWRLGDANLTGRPFHGAAIVLVQHVRSVGLDVKAHEPPPRHANILGWAMHPDPQMEKAERKEIALSIAEGSSLLLR